ncbi:MAG: universal stress protein [Acidobacteriota bacterium]
MKIDKILVPVDFSEHSDKALRYAPCPVLVVNRKTKV